MLKRIFLAFFLCGSFCLFGQQKIVSFANSLKTNSTSIKDMYPVVNENTGEVAVFISDAKSVYGYRFNNRFEKIDELIVEDKRREFKNFLGSQTSENGDYRIFLSNAKADKFLTINFSFTNKSVTYNEFALLRNYESYVQAFTFKNEFYLLSAATNVDKVYVYTFKEQGAPKRNDLDVSGIKLLNKFDNPGQITQFISPKKRPPVFYENTPTALEQATKQHKLFITKDEVILTIDENRSVTQFLTLDLNAMKATRTAFEKPYPNIKRIRKRSNSFVNGDHLFSIGVLKDAFTLQVRDLKQNVVLKEHTARRKEPIPFKNSPIIVLAGGRAKPRQTERTRELIDLLYMNSAGLSVLKTNDRYLISIGAYDITDPEQVPFTLDLETDRFGMLNYWYSESTRIDGLFDSNFNHVPKDSVVNAFEKIHSYIDPNWNAYKFTEPFGIVKNKTREQLTLFKYQDYFVLIELVDKSTLAFVKFTN